MMNQLDAAVNLESMITRYKPLVSTLLVLAPLVQAGCGLTYEALSDDDGAGEGEGEHGGLEGTPEGDAGLGNGSPPYADAGSGEWNGHDPAGYEDAGIGLPNAHDPAGYGDAGIGLPNAHDPEGYGDAGVGLPNAHDPAGYEDAGIGLPNAHDPAGYGDAGVGIPPEPSDAGEPLTPCGADFCTLDELCFGCDDDAYCATAAEADLSGSCNVLEPICACNGLTYLNPCLARAEGQAISAQGQCTP